MRWHSHVVRNKKHALTHRCTFRFKPQTVRPYLLFSRSRTSLPGCQPAVNRACNHAKRSEPNRSEERRRKHERGRRVEPGGRKTVLLSLEDIAYDHSCISLLSSASMLCLSPILHPPPLQSIATLLPVPFPLYSLSCTAFLLHHPSAAFHLA